MSASLGPEGIILGGETPSKDLDAIGQIPLLVTEDASTAWTSAVLLNSTETTDPAYAIFSYQALNIFFKKWTNRYPSGSPTADAMPMANVSTMWGDFHILGDIIWLANRSLPFASDNAARFAHGLWFSQPDSAEAWDPVDVQFIGQSDDDNKIVGMFPIQAGMIVLSTNGAHMLRGNPDFNEYEQLRAGVGPASRKSATYWPSAGVVVWVDSRGQIWQTNGESFGRLDTPLPEVGGVCASSIVAYDDFLIVSRNSRMYALRLVGNEGIWTELNSRCTMEMHRYEGSVYSAKTTGGLMRFAPEYDARGVEDDVAIGSKISTRTLQGPDQHKRDGWHRFGIRLRGDGTALSVSSNAGPAISEETLRLAYPIGEPIEARFAKAFPAHGPSKEASFTVEGEGDVIYEAVNVWSHSGKDER